MFDWKEFYVQVSAMILSGVFLFFLGWLTKGIFQKFKSHDERFDVHDNLASQSFQTIIKSDLIAEGKMPYPIWHHSPKRDS